MQPQMSQEEINWFSKFIAASDRVFEWGSGGSTVTFGKLVAQWIAIEHDSHWTLKVVDELVKRELAYKVTVRHVPPTVPGDYPQGRATTFKEMRDYVLTVHEYDKFDIIFVDGRARVPCAIQAIAHLTPDGQLFFHDYHRPRYKPIEAWLEHVGQVQSLARFKLKKA